MNIATKYGVFTFLKDSETFYNLAGKTVILQLSTKFFTFLNHSKTDCIVF